MNRYLWKTTILLVSILLFTACTNQAKEEAQEEEVKSIQFGKKVDMGEKENLESIFEFLEDTPLPQLEASNPEDTFYRFWKKDIDKANPMYLLELTYDKKDFDVLEKSLRVSISNREDATNFHNLERVESEIVLDGIEVQTRKSEHDVVMVAFEESDLHYFLEFQPIDVDSVHMVTKEMIHSLEHDTDLQERMNQELRQSFEDNFVLPAYFATDVVLYTLSFGKGSIGFDYKKDMTNPGLRILPRFQIFHATTQDHSNWSDEQRSSSFQEIALPSGREAYMKQDSDGPYFYPYDDSKRIDVIEEEREFRVAAYNIKEAEFDVEPVHLIKLIDSIEE